MAEKMDVLISSCENVKPLRESPNQYVGQEDDHDAGVGSHA